jgi:hypothetical protein
VEERVVTQHSDAATVKLLVADILCLLVECLGLHVFPCDTRAAAHPCKHSLDSYGVLVMCALTPLTMQSTGCTAQAPRVLYSLGANLLAVHMHTRVCLSATYGCAWGSAMQFYCAHARSA